MIASTVLAAEGFNAADLAASVDDILGQTAILSIASVTPDARSWISIARFAYSEDLRLFFVSPLDTQHSQNLAQNPSVSATVFDSNQSGPKRGVQVFGTCELASGADLEDGIVEFGHRFGWFASAVRSPTDFDALTVHFRLYVVHPDRVKICDEPAFSRDVLVDAVCISSRQDAVL